MRRSFIILFLVGLLLAGPAVDIASACPLCKEANETNPALPRAYMYSIIFMLTVPAVVLTGFGIGFYRLSKSAQQSQVNEVAENDEGPVDDVARPYNSQASNTGSDTT